MDATDWAPLKRLFQQAKELPAEEQRAFLESACADDPSKQAQLASLLAAAGEADPFFDSLADAVLSLPRWSATPEAAQESDPLIGRTVRQYRIEELLGRGGMGVVYRARDTRLDRPVALKFLPRRLTGAEAATERFLVEARAAAALDHPNICTVHEIGEDEDGRLFIAMACYEGETLQQKLARGPLPIEEARDYARQVAAGLGAAHAHDIIHRDIKPGNVIVTPEGVVKVLDFGLAKLTDVTLTGTGTTLGTVAYMSPEQAEGDTVDHRTDLWSLGAVLYEMLTGERPFEGDSTAATIHRIVHEDPKPPSALRPEIPAELESLVGQLLAKDPNERPGSIAATGLHDGQTTRPDWDRDGARSNRRRIALAAAAIVVLVALGGWWFTRSAGSREEAGAVSAISDLRPSLAVLPLANRGGAEDDRFVAALSDQLLTELSKETGIRLASRQSVEAYRESPVREIGRELGVRYIVEGGVEADSSSVRLNLQLIHAANEAHLWSQVFERESTGSRLDLRTELTRVAAHRIGIEVLQSEWDRAGRLSTDNDEAYALYLRHRTATRPWNTDERPLVEKMLAGVELLEEAVRLDPEFGWAYGFLADANRQLYMRYDRLDERRREVKEALDRATELLTQREYLGIFWGRYYEWIERDYDRAIQEFTEAESPLGGAAFLIERVDVERRAGRWFEAVESARRHALLHPASSDGVRVMALTYHIMRRYDEALLHYDSALSISPYDPSTKRWRAYLLWHRDGDREAVRELERGGPREWWLVLQSGDWLRALEMRPGEQTFTDEYYVIPRSFDRGRIYLAAGDSSAAHAELQTAIDTVLTRLELNAEDDRLWRQLAWSYALMSQRDEALAAGRRALALMPPELDALIGAESVATMARVFGALGPADSALVYFDRLLSTPGPIGLSARDMNEWIGIDLIRRDPRFAELLRRHGLN